MYPNQIANFHFEWNKHQNASTSFSIMNLRMLYLLELHVCIDSLTVVPNKFPLFDCIVQRLQEITDFEAKKNKTNFEHNCLWQTPRVEHPSIHPSIIQFKQMKLFLIDNN